MKRNMKTLVAVVLATFILSLTGCKKESADLIIGTWQETEAMCTETFNGVSGEPYSLLESGETVTMTFKKDNSYISKLVGEGGSFEDLGTWSIEDNKLTIAQSEDELGVGSMTFNIDLLDKNNMTLSYSETDEEDSSHIVTIVLKLKKI